MKISELKLGQEVEINGHRYTHKGIHKIRKQNFGIVQQRVFETVIKTEKHHKYFDITFNAELVEKDEKFILK